MKPWLAAIAGLLLGAVVALQFGDRLQRLIGRGPDPATIADAALTGVQAQNKLVAFAAHFTQAVTSKQQRFGILSATKTLIVPGTVRYELDWNRVARGDLRWDAGTKTLTVRIPDPAIAGPEIDLTRIREYQDGALLMALTDAEAVLDAANRERAQAEMLAAANSPPLMEMARTATRNAVEATFKLPLAAAGVDARVVVNFAP